MSDIRLPPLSLYIHIPWCIKKCPYCDFNSHAIHNDIPEKKYLDSLLKDLDQDLKYAQGRPINSIFIGGGTPSLFSPQGFSYLLNSIKQKLEIVENAEITIEANPGATEQKNYSGYLDAGINRLSIGAQSFSDQKLKSLGRIHSSSEVFKAVDSARDAGFNQINLDLMFGLPEQTLKEALKDLETAINLSPQHVSWYQLTLEPNTAFYSSPPRLPADDNVFEIQKEGLDVLSDNGYKRYEISAYAKKNCQSRHNLNYWQFGDYLGIGAGAHSKITQIDDINSTVFSITRYWKTRAPGDYLDVNKAFLADSKTIPDNELALEFMMNALRLSGGFDPELFEKRTGKPLNSITKQLDLAQEKGVLIQSQGNIKASELGYLYLNDLLQIFL